MRVTQIIADLHVPDLAEARDFYTDYLGLAEEEFNLGWVARYTSPETGITLQLMTSDSIAPVNPTATCSTWFSITSESAGAFGAAAEPPSRRSKVGQTARRRLAV